MKATGQPSKLGGCCKRKETPKKMKAGMRLKGAKEDELGWVHLEYEVIHCTPGENGTVLKQDLTLKIRGEKFECEMHLTECSAPTVSGALDKMSGWLRRMAEAVEGRTEKSIPL